MAKSTDRKKREEASGAEGAEPGFEEALEQLEALVREMESDQMPLEELIGHYERGTRLHRLCQERLDEVQGRIELIRKNRDGQSVLTPFDEAGSTGAETEGSAEPTPEDTQENGELF